MTSSGRLRWASSGGRWPCAVAGGLPSQFVPPEKRDRNPGTPARAPRVSGIRDSSPPTRKQKPGRAVPPLGYYVQGEVRGFGPGARRLHSPIRQVRAGYHVALRATGLGECRVPLHRWVHGSRRVPGSCRQSHPAEERKAQDWGQEDPAKLL